MSLLFRGWMLSAFAPALLSAQPQRQSNVVVGIVVDSASRLPLAAAQLSLGNRTVATSADGRFVLSRPATDVRELLVRRIGYMAQRIALDSTPASARDTTELRIALVATALTLDAITVRSTSRATDVVPTVVLDGVALDRALAPSIAATIAGVPGVIARTNGPAATQPVIRGLAGDRVVVLEDGLRTGDIATTAADHAITIDPITARRIEIVRGPAALRYSSNVLGGVVDVIRDDIPRERPDRVAGHIGVQGESINAGGVTGGGLTAPLGPSILRLTGSVRTAGDTRTPSGALPFTDQDGFDVGAGVGHAGERLQFGVAVRDVRSFYGVPSSISGRTLPGSHDGGVYVDLRRSTARVETAWRRDSVRHRRGILSVSLAAQGIRFEQEELERGGFVGTRFGQLAGNGDLVMRFRHDGRVRGDGSVGVSTQWRDFRAEGSYTGTRPAVVTTRALFAHDAIAVGPLLLSAGARFDAVNIRPLDSTETRLLRGVRTRNWNALTGALAATWSLSPSVALGGSMSRAFRPPAVEELFSAGPHLATYAYEIGNPRLNAEQGWGSELLLRVTRPRLVAEMSAYRMWIDGFVYQSPLLDPATGGPLLDPRLRRYQVYQANQTRATLGGAEGRVQWELARAWALDGTLSYVRGVSARADSANGLAAGAPLPALPPGRARVQLRRDGVRWLAGLTVESAMAQRRVPVPLRETTSCTPTTGTDGVISGLRPAEFCPTDGFALVHLTVGRRWVIGRRLHALTAAVDNLLDADWRDHLWRAKQVAPQPGRNVRFLYRVTL
jgi:iron complex outermembrane recepter protein